MKPKHTSGPWRIHRCYANEQTRTAGHNGETWEYTQTYVSQGDKIIAQVQHQSTDGGWPHVHDVQEMWANAHLIAAAPELLEVLERLLATAEAVDASNKAQHGTDCAGFARNLFVDVRSIIAKAEGGAA